MSLLMLVLVSGLCFSGKPVSRPPLPIFGEWYIDRKEALVVIYQQANGDLYGRIIWASDPADNQRLQRETKPVLVLKRFRQEADGSWQHGTVNPPKIPVSLNGRITQLDENTLQIKVWKLWFSENLTWTRK